MPIRMVTATDKFIDKSLLVHGTSYDYSEPEFITSHTKTPVICGKHGPFLVSPNAHQRGGDCPVCAQQLRKKANFKSKFYLIKTNSSPSLLNGAYAVAFGSKSSSLSRSSGISGRFIFK